MGVDWSSRLIATWSLVVALVVVHVVTAVHQWNLYYVQLFQGLVQDRDLRFKAAVGGQYAPLVDAGDVYRLFTSTVLHGDALHLVVNGLALLALGRLLEPWFGKLRVLVWFSLGAVGASGISHLAGAPQSDGASGGAFALLGVALVLGWRHRMDFEPTTRRVMGPVLWAFTAGNVLLSFAVPFIDASAHLGGLALGLVFGLAARTAGFRTPGWVAKGLGVPWLLAWAVICVGGFAWAMAGPWPLPW